ncbi:MAG: hypothetical protein NVS2B16_03770 [Chloroflexota bacterium]
MNVRTDKAESPKRKGMPRRVPAMIEKPERKPMVFGWGANLNHRERESVKERVALFAGLALAAILIVLLGWGWYQDNVSHPAAVQAENNKPVAQVGSYTIRMGFFKRFEKFQQNQANQNLSQIQNELTQLQADPKTASKYAATIAQLQQQQQQYQQQLAGLPSQSLSALINNQVILQRSNTAGVPVTPQVSRAAITQIEKQAGGPQHLALFEKQANLSPDEFKMLITAQYLQSKLARKLSAGVTRTQSEVRASHILFSKTKQAQAQKVLQQVLHGANFAALAKKYSIDTASAKKGGDLGYFPRGAMVAPFEKAAFSMHVGDVKLVQSQYGWHIIKLTGHKRVRLTTQQYIQAQQNAYQRWATTQQQLMHVERFVAPASLPNPVNQTALANSGLSGQQIGQNPGPAQGQLPPGSHVPVTRSYGSTGKKK